MPNYGACINKWSEMYQTYSPISWMSLQTCQPFLKWIRKFTDLGQKHSLLPMDSKIWSNCTNVYGQTRLLKRLWIIRSLKSLRQKQRLLDNQ